MARAKLSVRTFTTHRRSAAGPWSSRRERSLFKQREEQFRCCSLIYKVPVLWRSGAAARYSCLHTPVETGTSPGCRVRQPPAPRARRRQERILNLQTKLPMCLFPQQVSGSAYSSPKVSTVTVFIFCSWVGLSLNMLRGVRAMASTTSMPSVTLPNAAY